MLEEYNIQTEIRPDFCKDSFHSSYHPEGVRDVLIFHFPNAEFPVLLCLGCHLVRSEMASGGAPTWVEEQETQNKIAVMGKRAKRRRCVLCGKDPETTVNGLKFCLDCSKKVEGKL